MAAVRVVHQAWVKPAAAGGREEEEREYARLPLTGFDHCMLKWGMRRRSLVFADGGGNLEQASVKLREALAQALQKWYPLAGRLVLEEDGTCAINCNDAGVLFVDAAGPFGQCDMSGLNGIDFASDFAPDLPFVLEEPGGFANMPLFAAQITIFDDGPGFAIGFTFWHAVVDGTSIWQFVKAWADIAHGEPDFLVPDLAARAQVINLTPHTNSATPHVDLSHMFNRIPLCGTPTKQPSMKVAVQKLHFMVDVDKLDRLKSKIWDEAGAGSSVSSYEAVTALLWRAIVRVKKLPEEQEVRYFAAVNCRKRCKNLPENYFGNAVVTAVPTTTRGELLSNGLAGAAALIHEAIKQITGEHIQSVSNEMERGKRGAMFSPNARPDVDLMTGGTLYCPSYRCDFGWGAPAHTKNIWRAWPVGLGWMQKLSSGALEVLYTAHAGDGDRMREDQELTSFADLTISPIVREG